MLNIHRGIRALGRTILRRRTTLFRRHLSDREAELLSEDLSRLLREPFSAAWVQNVARLLREVEAQMTGRIAGDVDDHILNYAMRMIASQVPLPHPRAHAEIGTLFGGSLILTLFALREAGSQDLVLAIDPLSGYYGQGNDVATGLPVTRETVEANLHAFGFLDGRVHLVTATSQSAVAIDALRGYHLASIWIDGDHSYQGLATDWANYSTLVRRGGYVLIDNYRDSAWPEVTEFVDGHLQPPPPDWEVAGVMGRSILVRQVGSQ